MSSFYMEVRDKNTGEILQAFALDDYFGRRKYGYIMPGRKEVMKEDEFFKLFERVEISQGDKP